MESNDGDARTLSPDTVFELLAEQRRRLLLYALFQHSNPMTLPTIADCVTEWESCVPADAVPKERLRIYMSLYHAHVPKLETAGVVAYSQPEDMVELNEAATALEPHLKRAAERDLAPSNREG
ncbi:hypothetical protein ACFQJD_14505 [Haloplanus sp. GCM10025708]|uniref:DUF7344 domain-containing protein n=1 Tax=Haloferacaceae TaxID=1644056 RepID=UPI00360E003A